MDVHAVASRPGPVESAVLDELEARFTARRRATGSITMRWLEGGEGAPVVLVHGRGHAGTMWLPVLRRLYGRRIVAIDLPGFGHSSSRPFRGGGFDAAVRFFAEPVEQLLLELGLRGAAVVGHSLGGLVATELALRGQVQPSALVLIGAMGLGPHMTTPSRLFFHAGPERIARAVGRRIYGTISPFSGTPEGETLEALSHELAAVAGGRPDAAAAFDAMVPLSGPVPNRADRLASIEAPTLVLWGEKDEVFPSPIAISAAASIPRARLVMLPLGHSPHLEDPDAVVPELSRALP